MQRVYTDERFPGCRIVNDGSAVFRVYYREKLLQSFESYEATTSAGEAISEPTAKRRAEDYFDRWARMDMDNDSAIIKHETPIPGSADQTEPPENVTKSIDDMMAKERMERDPARKQALRRQVMHLMQHEGSIAVAVVNELIAG